MFGTMVRYNKETRKNMIMSALTFLARRFIAGQNLSQALNVAEKLNKQGLMTTLDYLGEDVASKDDALAATEEYINILRSLKDRNLDKYISIKLTQIGLAIDKDLCKENLIKIVEEAQKLDGFVRVDIEGSKYTSDTFEVIKTVKTTTAPLGAAVQAMLKRTPSDLSTLIDSEIPVRLCKGAYKEPANIAYQKRNEVDVQFLALMKELLLSQTYNAIATHDDDLIEATKAYAKNNSIAKDSFEFQMLMGIRRNFQKKLAANGWRLRVYVPYGSHWLPYIIRRLREKKENLWFVIKHFFRK